MNFENEPSSHEVRLYHFDNLAAENQRAKTIMAEFITAGYLDEEGVFEEDEERIDLTARELAHALISPLPMPEDVATIGRCLRFGLRLSMLLGQRTPGYMAGLDSLQIVLQEQHGFRRITTSHQRYLSQQPHTREIVLDNLRGLMGTADPLVLTVGLNTISFVLEAADHETFMNREIMSMYLHVSDIFGHPKEL
jgi:hypothetical protein